MLRRMWPGVPSRADHHVAQAIEHWPHRGRRQRTAGEFRAQKLKNDIFGEAQQVWLRTLAFPRAILGDASEHHADAVAAGFLHRAVNRTRRLFRRKTSFAF